MICLRTSTLLGFRVRSEEASGKPVGIPDGVQWMRGPELSLGPLVPLPLPRFEFKGI